MEPADYIRRETVVSIIISVILSALFFVIVFGWAEPITVWGSGGIVFDFLPQGFMVGLMATLAPGLLTRAARRAGKVRPLGGAGRRQRNIAARAVAVGLLGALLGVVGSAALLGAAGIETLGWVTGLVVKLAWGALLAAMATPASLRAELTKR